MRKSIMKLFKKLFTDLTIFLIGVSAIYGSCNNCCCIPAKLDRYVQKFVDQNLFSGAVLVAEKGKMLLCKAYGMANLEHGVFNKPDTKFNIESITKSFTALAIMKLQELDLLSVQDNLSKYIPDYPHGTTITIHHLLSQTSGIKNSAFGPDYKKESKQSYSLEQRIALFKDHPQEFAPGEKFDYGDNNYVLLSYIIEKVSGQSYEKFLQKYIFEPLDMRTSGCTDYKRIIKHRAAGYTFDKYDELVNGDYIDKSFEAGAGTVYSTVRDMYRLDKALYSNKILSQKSLNAMFTPHNESYGYGWVIKQTPYGKVVSHSGGGFDGFSSYFHRNIHKKICIIILNNIQDMPVIHIAENLERIVLGKSPEQSTKKPIEISMNPAIYDQYVGSYRDKSERWNFVVSTENNRLLIEINGLGFTLHPASETEFFLKNRFERISFIKDEGIITLVMHRDGHDLVAEKIDTKEQNINLSAWQQAIEQRFASKRSGQFTGKDKLGDSVTFEWLITHVREPAYLDKMHSLTDLFVKAFGPNEIRFLKEHPEAALRAGPNDPYKELVPLFKNGVESIEWTKVEEAMALMARTYWKSKTSEKEMHKYANSQFILVIAKDTATQKQLGFCCYQIDDDNPEGAVILEPLAVIPEAQSRGIGKLLTASIFKLVPDVTRIALTVESKNAIALKAYQAWGFVFVEYPGTDASHKTMEYLAEKCDNLQKIARTLRD